MKPNARILIVEDEPIPAEYLSRFLTKHGYTVIAICDTGAEAIRVAIAEKPDVILMDIMLKDSITGTEAAIRIADRIQTRIIFLTAYAEEEMLEEALASQAINSLLKPYQDQQILAALIIALQKPGATTAPIQTVYLQDGYRYDPVSQKLFLDNTEIGLGGKKQKLFHLLCTHADQTVSPEQISQTLYGTPNRTTTVRTLIYRLKKHFDTDFIHTVSGAGYSVHTEPIS